MQGGRSSSPHSLSRARFARVLVAFRKEKENNICVQATVIVNYYFTEKLTLQYLSSVQFLYIRMMCTVMFHNKHQPRYPGVGGGGWGVTPLPESNGDMPLDGVAYSQLE